MYSLRKYLECNFKVFKKNSVSSETWLSYSVKLGILNGNTSYYNIGFKPFKLDGADFKDRSKLTFLILG